MTTFVLIHGMGHGGWCWEAVEALLVDTGHTVHAPDLPLTSLDDDAAAVVELLDSIDGPKVLVGHSYGGLVISRAADQRTDLTHLFYIAAAMVGPDELLPVLAGEYPTIPLAGCLDFTDDGWVEIADPAGASNAFYQRCDPEAAAAATARLRRTSMSCLMTPTGAEPWNNIASTYVLCEQDGAIHPDLQRTMSARAQSVVVLDTDHSPFLSTPTRTAEILMGS